MGDGLVCVLRSDSSMTCWGEQALSANNVAKVVIGGGNGICFLRLDNTLDCGSVNPYSEGGLIDIFRGPD